MRYGCIMAGKKALKLAKSLHTTVVINSRSFNKRRDIYPSI